MDEQEPNININQAGGVEPKHSSNGALIGSIIIIAILVIGGIYLFSNQRQNAMKYEDDTMMESETMMEGDAPGTDLEMSNSDELSDIESDLEATENMELDASLE